jgi:hypothetical protein
MHLPLQLLQARLQLPRAQYKHRQHLLRLFWDAGAAAARAGAAPGAGPFLLLGVQGIEVGACQEQLRPQPLGLQRMNTMKRMGNEWGMNGETIGI